MQNIHFTNNAHPKSFTDRAWKVRSVLNTLQKRFAAGYKVTPVLAFDEAIIPSRSRYNPTRQYLKDKPHKWGTKDFMTCCAKTAYCLRGADALSSWSQHGDHGCFWSNSTCLYCGKQQHIDEIGDDDTTADIKSGTAAVARNLNVVLPPQEDWVFFAGVTDRFYTSVQGAIQPLGRGGYRRGTILANKAGRSGTSCATDSTNAKSAPSATVKLESASQPSGIVQDAASGRSGASQRVITCSRSTCCTYQHVHIGRSYLCDLKASRPRASDDEAASAEDIANEALSSGDQRRRRGRPGTRRRLIASDHRQAASAEDETNAVSADDGGQECASVLAAANADIATSPLAADDVLGSAAVVFATGTV
ncbi:unnamed protein product [Phytophthora fragariaefolia]|uniref:Unnamed protein product n=1 Tax=Phytophthora fragariaefolia TaxID=1490495 RepID=A0A9W6XWI5_9STRA|nr:unnamed protein product [Phytophthora fragariaefolia]